MKKLIISLIFANLLLAVFSVVTSAETIQQMRERVANELINAYPIVNTCDANCQENWITADGKLPPEQQFLRPLAERIGLPLTTTVRANIAFTIKWGYDFENLYGRPPSFYDWVNGYADRNERFRYLFNVSPELYRINRWSDDKIFRLKKEYGGDF